MKHQNKTVNMRILSIIVIFLFVGIILLCTTPCYQAQESEIIVEINPSTVESDQNFTVSVYDPDIQVGTPYLVNVTILFNEQFYQITPQHENGELILTAPDVMINKTYVVEAYTKNQAGNNTVTVIPATNITINELVIIPETYHIHALHDFSVLIMDKNGKAIQNATVSIQNATIIKTTNNEGRVTLKAPNTEEITIIAQKNGYINVTKTVFIITKQTPLNSILSHPYTPIIISGAILFFVILYVSIIKNTPLRNKFHLGKKRMVEKDNRSNEHKTLGKPIPVQNYPVYQKKDSPHIEEIHIASSHQDKVTNLDIQNTDSPTHFSSSHNWFSPPRKTTTNKQQSNIEKKTDWAKTSDTLHHKIDKLLSEKSKENKKAD